MRHVLLIAAATGLTAVLAGCVMNPDTPRYDPRYPTQTSELEPIDPYATDDIPSTAYEIWKRDKERNDRVAGNNDKDSYPPLFKGQRDGGPASR